MSAARGTVTLDRLREGGERMMTELSRELYLAQSGQKASAELQPVYARHARVIDEESLAMVRELFVGSADASEERRAARLLLDWQVESQSSRELAPLDEREIAWEGSAIVRLPDGRGVEYQRVLIELAQTTDRAARLELERARYALIAAELAPMRRERLEREREITESLDLADGYLATWELLSGIDLRGLATQCEQFLRDTQAMWDEVRTSVVRRKLGIDPREATRGDVLALLRDRSHDPYFPAREMEERVRKQVRSMGIDPAANGRVIFDTGEREGKRSRAFCAPVRIPDEVYLVLRPHGGTADWSTFLHELGHALHFAYMSPTLPFEDRWLGDNSVTESYAMLFDHRMQDGAWLKRYSDLGAPKVPEYLRTAGFDELHFLRRYCSKLLYEVELYGGSHPWASLPDLFVDRLSTGTGFRYDAAEAFVDVDPRFYAARYLRAWQLQALLNETLVERFDVDWWRNPRAGPWICAALFGEGQRELGHELAQRVSGKALDFGPLVRAVEGMLA